MASLFPPVVKNASNEGEERLQGMKKDVEKLQEETALALKKNVYKNYSQFIETAKEISSEYSNILFF